MQQDYTPIDYRKWVLGDKARKGLNIKRLGLLNDLELKIFDATLNRGQDNRNDPGHAETSTYLAFYLLKHMKGQREIVIPTIILHDIGFYGTEPDLWDSLVKKYSEDLQKLEGEVTRRPHQNRGVFLAGQILTEVGYFEKYSTLNGLEIADIIGDHDTKKLPPNTNGILSIEDMIGESKDKEPLNNNGQIVRIADFLWRPTLPCTKAYSNSLSAEELIQRVEEVCLYDPKSPLNDIGLRIAKFELANTIFHKFGEQKAKEVLSSNYAEEFESIKEFYSE